MDWAVFDSEGRKLEGPYDDLADGDIRAQRAVRHYPPEDGAWAAPVCDWHPSVPRESCPEYPHE